MIYATYTDVRRIIATGLEDADITALITQAEAEMTERDMNFSANNMKTISSLITASLVALKDPKSSGAGEYSETNRDPQDWRDQAETLMERLAKKIGVVAEPVGRRG